MANEPTITAMTEAEVTVKQQEEQAWAAGAASRAAAEVQANRRAAYQAESDELFFQEQAGEISFYI